MKNNSPALSSVMILGFSMLTLTACGGGGGNVDPDDILQPLQEAAADTGLRDITGELVGDSTTEDNSDAENPLDDTQPAAPQGTILSDPVTFNPLEVFPAIVELQQHENSGLLLGYTDASQIGNPDLEFVNDAWLEMQECLGITADAPLVVLRQESVEPLASTDDICLLYTSPSPRDATLSRMPSSA